MQVLKFIKYLIVIFFCALFSTSLAFKSEIRNNNISKLQIISATNNNETFLGLKFELKDQWQIYGKNHNQTNQQPQISFSPNLQYKIIWPKAIQKTQKIGNKTIKYNIYKNEVIIPIKILDNITEQKEFIVNIDYVLCKQICIPIKEEFNIKLTPNDFDTENLQLIQKYIQQSYDINLSLFYAIIFALIGGLILNLMPCVFPVLSIKLINLIKYSGHHTKQLRLVYLSTIAGNIFTFIIIASFIAIFKEIGQSFGWGIQFQNPYFLVILALIIFYFAIYSLKGNIYIPSQILSNLNNKINQKQHQIFLPNFLSGVLTVLLATPCSAPFLGSAISFALSQNTFEIFTILIAISIGLALPYIILLIYPKLTYRLPKPGAWMNKVKKIMFLALMATIIWLLFVLSNFIGWLGCLFIVILLIISLKFLHKNQKHTIITIFLVTIITSFIPSCINYQNIAKNQKYWIEFDENKIQPLVQQNKIVIINITADWCLTCKFNEIMVFNSKEVIALIKKSDIIAMRGDLTKANKKILDFIKSHNRQAIPFTIIYSKKYPQGILTSELITKVGFLKLIN